MAYVGDRRAAGGGGADVGGVNADRVHKQLPGAYRLLFQWHSRTFYPYARLMTSPERAYLDAALDVQYEPAYRHFSHYTYSHRVKGSDVNSSRTAHGTFRSFRSLREAFDAVVRHRGLERGPMFEADFSHDGYGPFGLGWDFEEDLFKVYFAVKDHQHLEHDGLLKLHQKIQYAVEPMMLTSHTYEGRTLIEKKLYVYPTLEQGRLLLPHGLPFRNHVNRVAMMYSDVRGVEQQLDVSQDDDEAAFQIGGYLNEKGVEIVGRYVQGVGSQLDTLTWNSPDDFTLYFP
jgi:hypothetical protein